MQEYPKPRAVVLHRSGVFYDNGRSHPLSGRTNLDDLAAVLAGAQQAFRGGEGVVMLDTAMPAPAEENLRAEHRKLWTERLTGWKFTELRPWTTFTGNGVIHLGFLPDIMQRPGPLLAGAAGPADIANRLGRYQALVGISWRYTAGVSGCAALRSRHSNPKPGKQPLWQHAGPKGIRGNGPLIWRNHTVELDPGDARFVAMFDINGQYLAALRNISVAWSGLEHSGQIGFDPKRAGYWELSTADLPAELLDGADRPPVVRAARVHNNGVWVTTPTAKYLTERLGSLDVLDSHTCPNSQGIFRPFAERLASARVGDMGPVGTCELAIKRTYAELVGMMGREGGSIYRPDWHHSTVDLGTMNLLRKLDQVHELLGVRPFEVRTDAAYFLIAADRDELVRLTGAIGVGSAPGTFKNARTFTVAEHLESAEVRHA